MRKNYIQGLICVGITTILFSLMEVILKFISNDIQPVQITFSRFLIGGLVLLPFSIRALKKSEMEGIRLEKNDMLYCLVLGMIGVTISMTFYQLAVFNAEASTVAVLFSSNPLFVFVLAYLILGEPIRVRNIVAVIFALYSVLSKPKCNKLGGITVTCLGFISGSIVLLLLVLIGHIKAVSDFLIAHGLSLFANVPVLSGYSLQNIGIVIFVYVVITGIGYASYFTAVEKTDANTASLTFFFKPKLAPIFALLILHETISIHMIVGIALILTGSYAQCFASGCKTKAGEM